MGGDIPHHKETTSSKEETPNKLDPLQMMKKERRSSSDSDSDSDSKSHSSSDSSKEREEDKKIKALEEDIKGIEGKLEEKNRDIINKDNRMKELDIELTKRDPEYDDLTTRIKENFQERMTLGSKQDALSRRLDNLNEQMGLSDLYEHALPQGSVGKSQLEERDQVTHEITTNEHRYRELEEAANQMRENKDKMLASQRGIEADQRSEYVKVKQERKDLAQEAAELQQQKKKLNTEIRVLRLENRHKGQKTLEQMFTPPSSSQRGSSFSRKRLFDPENK